MELTKQGSEKMKQENLLNVETLTESDIDQIVTIVGNRCRVKTVNQLRSILTYSKSLIGNYGIYSRLIREDGKWSYIAGQSYTDEIRTLRECILNG